jgi:DNA-binding Lrp family transcriptional regulator
MPEKSRDGSKKVEDEEIIEWLLEDPTRSLNTMAKAMNIYRQTLWRRKKKLEDEKVIWGYTAVIDENKLGNVIYLVMMKMKPMTRGMADIIYRRIKNNEMSKSRVRLIDAFHVNGEYDWILRFSAPDHATARKYYDAIRVIYEEYLIEKPVIVDVNFILKAEGMRNPELEKLYNFVPEI